MKRIMLIGSVLLCIACTKNELGGDATIEGTVIHHNKIIKNAVVYMKFNATDQPADTTLYDAKVKVNTDGYFKFKAYKGHYFIYALGKDYGIQAPYIVNGGQSVTLRSKETVSVSLYVTEGD